MTTSGPTPERGGARRPERVLAGLLAAACAVGVLVLWYALIYTRTGQLMEDAALTGSRIGERFIDTHARALLSTVSMPAAVALVLLILLLGLWRGSRRRAVGAAVAVVAINASTQLLKHQVLSRPDYGLSPRWDGANTLPSGHTAVAASAAVALVLVVGPSLRGVAAWGGALLTAAMGYSTLVCQWHRPADVISAVLLATAWGSLAVACGIWQDEEPGGARAVGPAGRGPDLVLLGGLGALAGAVGLLLEAATWWAVVTGSGVLGRTGTFIAYAAGSAGTVAVSCACLALLAGLAPARVR
ncbi:MULTISPECIES: phosphatase PAP2 family protein [unclassified Actinomyces]|uniref:phosphatase PAP2 family protein n=1 Tax=unclassified Actinomyces TaxID=2609248 RepID=UPI002016FB44|nr:MULTISPECIES: phosphatase PAP2 family protein [unclassified Actinomyces]